jgi:hemerythrin-like domain-containing protein
MTSSDIQIRRPGEPVPDLTDYRVVHRAMTTDLDRLATTAAKLVDRHDGARLAALRYYLRAVSYEIESHHRAEDDDLWPFLEAVAGDRTVLVPLSEDHERLDPLLHRANELAARERAAPELASVLREVADLLVHHIAAEERDIFPIILDRVGVADYARLQKRFRGNLRPAMLPFLAPWALRHATAAERSVMLAEAGWVLRVIHCLFAPRFQAREELLFGAAGLPRKDEKTVGLMRRFARLRRIS